MKARLPKGYGKGSNNNLQQLAMKAQKMQDEMENITAELEEKEYKAIAPGGQVKVVATGKFEVKNIEIAPEIVNKEDIEMMSDLIILAVNEAIRQAVNEKNQRMESISDQINLPNISGLF